jgi:hypothetical protein
VLIYVPDVLGLNTIQCTVLQKDGVFPLSVLFYSILSYTGFYFYSIVVVLLGFGLLSSSL